ncbi:uncharacterized protein LOC127843584 [Dreissena polymorpha]|uniref:uncharacterized protein LOC127843584 n=1 Tax=Dreissena polymorpha TaxID=45954 RepID=UPI002264F166|nr:uncharacterized protein LOC127843584 [Dreissena polymorpha]
MPAVPPHLPVESDSSSNSDSDEDDHYLFPILQQAVSQHTNSLAGNGIQFAEPIGTPIINQIKSKTRKLIWKNMFVDMAFLLPSSQNPSTLQFTLQLDDQHSFTINPTSRSKKINTIEAWTTAFIRFMAVYLHKYPFEAQQLLKYMEIVRDIARRRPGMAFLYYDTQFRLLRESVLMPWDSIHREYWLMACMSFQQPQQPFRPKQPPNRSYSTGPPPSNGFSKKPAGISLSEPLVVTKNAHSPTSVAFVEVHMQHTTANSATKNRQPKPSLNQTSTLLSQQSNNLVVTPIKVSALTPFLQDYPLAQYLILGFTHGFKLGYTGQHKASTSPNLKSCDENPDTVQSKLQAELNSGRVKGPFTYPPFENFRVSPIGLVPNKTPGQFRLIHHLSYPRGNSVNDFIDPNLSSVNYSPFDDAVNKLLELGTGTLFCKTDIDSAFRLIPIHANYHHLLGFKFRGQYYFDTCLPMGASSSSAIFERLSCSLQHISENILLNTWYTFSMIFSYKALQTQTAVKMILTNSLISVQK